MVVIYHELANLQAQSDNILTIFTKTPSPVRSRSLGDLESLPKEDRLYTCAGHGKNARLGPLLKGDRQFSRRSIAGTIRLPAISAAWWGTREG